jgi:aminoglycoside phosphotransferase (APT) family kinase protein
VSRSDEPPAVVAEPDDAARPGGAPLLPLAPLTTFLDAQGIGAGELHAEPIGDGHSNLTYLIRRGDERWVLRRPPRPPLPPSAHDVLREFRILQACAHAVRVPAPVAACADAGVIGAPFYVMGYVEGAVMTTDLPSGLDAQTDPPRIADELVDGLVEIHALDWRSTDLADLAPPPESYLERQLRRFTNLWDHNRTRELAVLDKVTAWLERKRPESSDGTLVHGDYRLGNTIFSESSPARLQAILDWELSTVGDPLADVGYLSATWAAPGEARDPLVRLGLVTAGEAFPPRGELVERYSTLTGRGVKDLGWYEAFALWKSAVFLEGSYARLLSGTTDDPFFAGLKDGVPELAERAWELACAKRSE